MRIDRYLHCIRFARSRTLAQTIVAAGHVRIDGKRVEKPSDEVRIGSVIALPLNRDVRIVCVVSLPARRGSPAQARLCYEELGIDAAQAAT